MDSVVRLITDANASRAVVADTRPKIVLAGSGMITGGRIIHYLDIATSVSKAQYRPAGRIPGS
jgi:predicted metal-dependent RNase